MIMYCYLKLETEMKKICYEINPERLGKNEVYKTLSLMEKGMLFSIFSELWGTESQYKIVSNYEQLSYRIGCSEVQLMSLISKFKKNEDSLLKVVFNLDDFSEILVSEELKKQANQFRKDKEVEYKIIDAVRESSEKKEKSLIERIRLSENLDRTATIKYLEKEKMDISKYTGWMPTKSFDHSGQVYVLPCEFISTLKKEFSESPVEEYLEIIFNWLVKNVDKRQTIANMNNFIMRWIERSLESNPSSDNMKEIFSQALLTIDIDESDINFDFK